MHLIILTYHFIEIHVMYKNNEATVAGGAVVCFQNCIITNNGDSNITFIDNRAEHYKL